MGLAYELWGEGAPLVLLHGALLSKDCWRPILPLLSPHRRLVLLDLPGHGQTQLRVYSVEGMAQTVEQQLKTLDLPPVWLCGHSLGGMVAQALAHKYPQRVRGLILADTSYCTQSNLWEAWQVAFTRKLLRWLSVHAMARLTAWQTGRSSLTLQAYLEKEISGFAGDKAHYWALWEAILAFDSRSWIKQIDQPSLILLGQHNPQTHRQGRQMQAWISSSELHILPKAGHMLFWDNPSGFAQAVLRFSDRLQPTVA